MGIGIAFTYLLIAAPLAPVLWVLWWAADSVASRGQPGSSPSPRLRAFQVASERQELVGIGSSFVFPRPSDKPLAGRAGEVVICRLSDGAEVGHCQGPDHAGKCPRPLADGSVPCAGFLLALPVSLRGSLEWHIPAGYRACFLGSYDVYRQPRAGSGAPI